MFNYTVKSVNLVRIKRNCCCFFA